MPDLNSEALDFRAASDSFAAVRRLRQNDLETLRFVTPHQGRKVPTVGGVLLFGEHREEHFPDAWIQAGRFHGRDKSRIADRTDIRSHWYERSKTRLRSSKSTLSMGRKSALFVVASAGAFLPWPSAKRL